MADKSLPNVTDSGGGTLSIKGLPQGALKARQDTIHKTPSFISGRWLAL